jgi:hypothetical protein
MIKTEDHQALAAFARLYGRCWRRELARRWENGTLLLSQVSVSEDELSRLVRLKGTLGPSGLTRYRPSADPAAAKPQRPRTRTRIRNEER